MGSELPGRCPAGLAAAIREVTRQHASWQETDERVAAVLRQENRTGDVVSFTPPGDIHRVSNRGDLIAISLHVYGADISRPRTSVRRIYGLPVLQRAR